jgi:hypothetical protein
MSALSPLGSEAEQELMLGLHPAEASCLQPSLVPLFSVLVSSLPPTGQLSSPTALLELSPVALITPWPKVAHSVLLSE